MNKFVKNLSVAALAVGLVTGAFSSTAFANPIDNNNKDAEATATVEGGSLSIKDNVDIVPFTDILLNGSTQEVTTSVNPFSVMDATGTGSGWNLRVTAGQLTSTDGNTLPMNSLNISAPNVTGQEGSSATSTITPNSGYIDNETGVKLLTASDNGGMGTFDIADTNLTLMIQPKDAMEGTYSSTVTFNLVTGP